MADDIGSQILRAVDQSGVMLVHDQVLPSVTALVAGGPVTGSWWSHPACHRIYNALGSIENEVVIVKLVRRKDTLIARRLWPDFAAVAMARASWQLAGLEATTLALLDRIDAAPVPVKVTGDERDSVKQLAARLLVRATEIHTEMGHHATAYSSWHRWAKAEHVMPSHDVNRATATFETIAAQWPTSKGPRLLPW